MVDGEEDREGESDLHRHEASTSFLNALSSGGDAIRHAFLAVWSGLEDRPILRFTLGTVVSVVLGRVLVAIAGWTYAFFFGSPVPFRGVLKLETFPLPVGVSLWLLTVLWVGTGLWALLRITELRQEINALQG